MTPRRAPVAPKLRPAWAELLSDIAALMCLAALIYLSLLFGWALQ